MPGCVKPSRPVVAVVVIRSRCEIEEHNNHERIIVTEIPYQVNKSELVKAIADLINDKKIRRDLWYR